MCFHGSQASALSGDELKRYAVGQGMLFKDVKCCKTDAEIRTKLKEMAPVTEAPLSKRGGIEEEAIKDLAGVFQDIFQFQREPGGYLKEEVLREIENELFQDRDENVRLRFVNLDFFLYTVINRWTIMEEQTTVSHMKALSKKMEDRINELQKAQRKHFEDRLTELQAAQQKHIDERFNRLESMLETARATTGVKSRRALALKVTTQLARVCKSGTPPAVLFFAVPTLAVLVYQNCF